MLQLTFSKDSLPILVLNLDETIGSRPFKVSGDDSWFNYQVKVDGLVASDNPQQWAESLAEAYQKENGNITVEVVNLQEKIAAEQTILPIPVVPPTPSSSSVKSQGQPVNAPYPQQTVGSVHNKYTNGPSFQGRPLSGWWKRAAAIIMDGIFVVFAFIPLMIFAFLPLWFSSESTESSSEAAFFLLILFSLIGPFVIATLYYCLTMARKGEKNGQTWGKQIMGITVVREDGIQVSFGYAFVRQILVIGILVGFVGSFLFYIPYLLNYLWPLWDDGNQALHDKVVSSRVVCTSDN
jgi:uncharacterized RDD family membrane protein YckC